MAYRYKRRSYPVAKVSNATREKMRSQGYVELGIFDYKKEGNDEDLMNILDREDSILIIPERYSRTSWLKARMCPSLENDGYCQYEYNCFNAHNYEEIRSYGDPISKYLLEMYSWYQPSQKITIFQKANDSDSESDEEEKEELSQDEAQNEDQHESEEQGIQVV